MLARRGHLVANLTLAALDLAKPVLASSDQARRHGLGEATTCTVEGDALADAQVIACSSHDYNDDTLNRAAFALGQLVGAQLLDQRIVRDELTSAAVRIGLPRGEAQRTITSGLTAGIRCPRQHSA